MTPRRTRSLLAVGLVSLAVAAVPAFATIKPRTGTYTKFKCPQGFMSFCGEAAMKVTTHGTRIATNASVPWPNDPKKPSIGLCNRVNPFLRKPIVITNGRFTAHGTTSGHAFTWTGHWVSSRKVVGTVKWAGCATVARYSAT
jgi:hypothetical protein